MIPARFHHVWPGNDPFRAEFHRFRATFIHHHPDWTFFFWRTELGDRASADVRALLEDPNYTVVVKSDVARFEVLRLHGGVYVDTDVECLRPFGDVRHDGFCCGRESEGTLCPSVMGSVPGHPLVELAVREALERVRRAGPERANAHPNEVSGPAMLTELVQGRGDVRVYDEGAFYPIRWWETNRLGDETPDAYAKHWWNGATSLLGWTHQRRIAGSTPDESSAPERARTRYDLGGAVPRRGYVSVPCTGRGSDCGLLDVDAIHRGDGEVDEFLLEHRLDHVPVTRYVRFLTDMHRKLRVGGALVVIQTDADAVIRQYMRGEISFRSMRATLFTPDDRVRDNPHNLHHSMWSAGELARDLGALGFDARVFDAGSWGFDMADALYPDDLARDHGKRIARFGVRGIKR
jgi:hypothetical protein